MLLLVVYFPKPKCVDWCTLPRTDNNLFPVASRKFVTNFSHAYFEMARDLRLIKILGLFYTLALNLPAWLIFVLQHTKMYKVWHKAIDWV